MKICILILSCLLLGAAAEDCGDSHCVAGTKDKEKCFCETEFKGKCCNEKVTNCEMLDCGTDGVCIEKVGSSPAFCQYGAADSCAACHKPDGVKSDLAQLEDEVLAAFAQMESFVGPVPTPPVPAAPPVRYRKPYCILDVASNFVAETPPASAEFHNFIVLYNKIYVVTMGYEGDDFYHYISCRDSSGVVNTVKYEMPNSVTDGPITGVTYDVKYQKLIVVRAVQTYQVNLNGTEAEFLSINKAPTLAEQRQVATYEDKIYVTLDSLNIVLAYNRANLILSEAFQLSYKPRAICRTQNGKFFVAGDAVVEIYDKNFNELNKLDIGQDAGFSALHCYSDCEGAVAVHKHTNSVHKLRYIDVEDGIIETFVFPAEPKAMHLLGDKLLVLTAQSTFGSVQLTL